MRRGAWLFVALASCASSGITPAAAQEVDPFERGRQLMLEQRYEEACPFIAESHGSDPRRGTLFTLAECERLRGDDERALALYRRFVDERPDDVDEREGARLEVAREQIRVLGPKVARKPSSSAQPAPATAPRGPKGGPPQADSLAHDSSSTWMAVGIASASAAGLALIVGTVAGGLAFAADAEADEHCNGGACRDQAGVDAGDEARALAPVSTVGFAVAGGLGALAIVSFVVATTEAEPVVALALTPSGVRLRGTW